MGMDVCRNKNNQSESQPDKTDRPQESYMLIRALLAFLLLPGIFAGLLPWLIAELDPWKGAAHYTGLIFAAAGLLMLLRCVGDFYRSGRGTLAPWNPPKKLVTCGLYRRSRNPMYLAVLLIIAGWGIGSASPLLLGYLFFAAAVFHMRIITHEEPWLASQFPRQWPDYANGVARWLPALSLKGRATTGK